MRVLRIKTLFFFVIGILFSCSCAFGGCGLGWGLEYDGVDDYVNFGDDESSKPSLPITLSAWINLSEIDSTQCIIGLDSRGSGRYYGVWFRVESSNKLGVYYGDGMISSSSHRRTKIATTSLTTGVCYHVAAVIKGPENMELYINGVDDGGTYSGYGATLAYSNTYNSFIGSDGGSYDFFNGNIDEVRIFDRALSAVEIGQLYQGSFGSDPNLLSYWDFDEGAGQEAADSAGGYDGYLGSDPGQVDDSDPCWVGVGLYATTFYVDDDAENDPCWYVPGENIGQVGLSDPAEDGSEAHPFDSIQKAISQVGAPATIVVEQGFYTGVGNYDIDPNGKVVFIRSTDPEDSQIVAGTIIDPNLAGRAFYCHSGEDATTIIAGFTITNCWAIGDSGGAIYCDQSSPMIRNCVITENTADSSGGGISLIYDSDAEIRDCVITFNDSVNQSAGGIYIYDSEPNIVNCLIANNSGMWSGGLTSEYFSNVNITNCTIADNLATTGPGGLACFDGGNVSIKNSIFWDNSGVEILRTDTAFVSVTYSDLQMDIPNDGDWFSYENINDDPLFGVGEFADYHLQSTAGRWVAIYGDFDGSEVVDCNDLGTFGFYWLDGNDDTVANLDGIGLVDFYDYAIFAENWQKSRWTIDGADSPCIDAGDPNSGFGNEPAVNGGVINMGVYGNTGQASKSH